MNNMLTVQEAVAGYSDASAAKASTRVSKLFVKAIFAGMMIGFGAAGSSVAAHNVANVGLSRLAAGVVFPMGLMMVILTGAELFTGDCLMIMGVAQRRVSFANMLRVLVLVYCGNLVGSLLVTLLVGLSGQFDYSNGLLGAYTIKVALGKCTLSFTKAFVSGMLCNVLVCAAVILAMCAKDVTGKLLASFFIILLFVVSGYEHCVANMYYIPAGLFASLNQQYVELAKDTYSITESQLDKLTPVNFAIKNLLPVTVGNIVGGMFVFGLPLWYANKKEA